MTVNNRQRLADHLLQWHGGGGKPTYATGSSWYANKKVPDSVGVACVAELKTVAAWMNDPKRTERHASKSERRELADLIVKVERQVAKDRSA